MRFFPPVQARLEVGQPGDLHEREADAVADEVMRMEGDRQGVLPSATGATVVQRLCTDCAKEEGEGRLQRQPVGPGAGPSPPRNAPVVRGATDPMALHPRGEGQGGRPLPVPTRDLMEDRFGTDFGAVRVHTDANAARLNRQLNARAFTHGSDIYFNDGNFAPASAGGKHLLAHELAHVVQQRAGGKRIQRQAFSSSVSFRQRLFSRYFQVPSGNSLTATIDVHRSPEGCTMPSTYTVYLYNTGEERYETSVTYQVDSRQSYTWKGLAGGTYQFILRLNGAAEGCRLDGTLETTLTKAAGNILPTIRKYVGDTRWAYTASTPPGANTNKCNQFVFEVLNEAGAAVPMMKRTRFGFRRPDHPPLAKQWADSSVSISGWTVVADPKPGDVAAQAIEYSDASGHVGIVSSVAADGSGKTISATADEVVENDWGFRAGQKVTFRRYSGR